MKMLLIMDRGNHSPFSSRRFGSVIVLCEIYLKLIASTASQRLISCYRAFASPSSLAVLPLDVISSGYRCSSPIDQLSPALLYISVCSCMGPASLPHLCMFLAPSAHIQGRGEMDGYKKRWREEEGRCRSVTAGL